MQKIIILSMLFLTLIPFSSFAFPQEYYDTSSTLSVSFSNDTPFVYQDSKGHTIVVGTVENNTPLTSITNVTIQVSFFDETSFAPLEVVDGHTILQVIPSGGSTPYIISSQTANPSITEASVTILGFDSSEDKQQGLEITSSNVVLDNALKFSGILKNSDAPNSDTNVYLAFYDGFDPPRTLDVHTIEFGDVAPNSKIAFSANPSIINVESKGFLLFAESDIFYSNVVDVKLPVAQSLSRLVQISNVTITDVTGEKISKLSVDSPVLISGQASIQFVDESSGETLYTYYLQIKNSVTGAVEYFAKSDGEFNSTSTQLETINWTPDEPGLYFIETFVWDRDNNPIAEKGPFVLFFVD